MTIVETGRVVALESAAVWVETIRSSACGSCAARSGCGHRTLAGILTSDKGLVRARESDSLKAADCSVNDRVEISIPRSALSAGALLLYGLPLVTGIALALLFGAERDAHAALGFFVGLLGAFAGLRWMTTRSLFGAVEPQLERIVESTVDEAIVRIQS
ncbi:MAG: SoxR reducing system RseC family protein [Pseudomonadota bacterium]|nr:SoxR reducing system RseC family protein [Pseudomonadota bacterium]